MRAPYYCIKSKEVGLRKGSVVLRTSDVLAGVEQKPRSDMKIARRVEANWPPLEKEAIEIHPDSGL